MKEIYKPFLREVLDFDRSTGRWESPTYLSPNLFSWDVCLIHKEEQSPKGDANEQLPFIDSVFNSEEIYSQISSLAASLLVTGKVFVFLLAVDERFYPNEWLDISVGSYLHDFYENHQLILKGSWRWGQVQGTLIVTPCDKINIEKVTQLFWGRCDCISAVIVDESVCDNLSSAITCDFIGAKSWQECLHPLIAQSDVYIEEIYNSRVLRLITTSKDVYENISSNFYQIKGNQ